jgi:hypothetical protein
MVPKIELLDDFGRTAALAVDDVAQFPEFILSWMTPPPKPQFKGISCERTQSFEIVIRASQQAELAIGACKREAAKIRELAVAAEGEGRDVLATLLKDAKPGDRARLDKVLGYRKVSLPGGMTGYAFAWVLVGHGVLFLHGAVVDVPARQEAYIVVGDFSQLCGPNGMDGKTGLKSRFCPDVGKALLDIAASLARRDGAPAKATKLPAAR